MTAPGSTADLLAREQRHRLPGGQTISELAGMVVARARNAEVWDVDGRRYLDLYTGVGVCNIGHSHPTFLAGVRDQLDRCIVGTFPTEARVRYHDLLTDQLPDRLDRVHLYSTGSEAVEAAVRLARSATGRQDVLSFWGGFHGKTAGALGLHAGPRRQQFGPYPPGAHHAPYAYCYRCPFGLTHPECQLHCLDFAAEAAVHQGDGDLAAIIVEPVQGTNGNVVPPPGFLRGLRRLADQHGALLILDEVITGFGRTGALFAFQHDPEIAPDVLVLGKAMASGVPVSAVVSRDELVENTPFGAPSAAASTFGGNPLAGAASLATLEVLLAEELPARAAMLGATVADRIARWTREIPVVGNAAAQGLMIGVELVQPGTRHPLPTSATRRLFRELLSRGVLAMAYDSRIRLYPPLTIPAEQLDEGLAALEDALVELSAHEEGR